MFDTSHGRVVFLRPSSPAEKGLPDPDALKEHCLEPASLWVLKRRANLPYMPPRRLPAVARVG